jgi:hypothetical protein
MVTTADPTAHPHHNLPTPDHAPLTREEEEELAGLDPDHIAPPDDDQLPSPDHADVDDMQRWVNDTLTDAEPPPPPGTPDLGEDLGSLQFEDLSPRRVPPTPLPAALLDVATVRTAYQQALDEHDALAHLVATFNGPAATAAMPQIRELRAAAEADQPYWLAVQEVIDQWADADAQYDAALAQIDWAQAQLDNLLNTPDADPLDIASARADLRLRRMTLPTPPPPNASTQRSRPPTPPAPTRPAARTTSSPTPMSTKRLPPPTTPTDRRCAPPSDDAAPCAATSIAPNSLQPHPSPPPTAVPSNTCSHNKQTSRQSCGSSLPPAATTPACR